jgi:hypothetical protein
MNVGTLQPHKRGASMRTERVAGDAIGDDAIWHLASYQKCVARICAAWPAFAARRHERLQQGGLFGPAVEKIAENILEDLFTTVLDWPAANVKPQVDRATVQRGGRGSNPRPTDYESAPPGLLLLVAVCGQM